MLIKLDDKVSVNPEHIVVSYLQIHDCTVSIEIYTVDARRHVVHVQCKNVALAEQTKANIEKRLAITN